METNNTDSSSNESQTLAGVTTERAAEATDLVTGKLTPEQIQNWRTAMVGMLGGYALIMPEDQIQRLRDKMQEWAEAS